MLLPKRPDWSRPQPLPTVEYRRAEAMWQHASHQLRQEAQDINAIIDPSRRFPSPWWIEDNVGCYTVCDRDSQALAYVYYAEASGQQSIARLLSKNEAWRIAANMAKLPDLMRAK
jgi:hypothetical protein